MLLSGGKSEAKASTKIGGEISEMDLFFIPSQQKNMITNHLIYSTVILIYLRSSGLLNCQHPSCFFVFACHVRLVPKDAAQRSSQHHFDPPWLRFDLHLNENPPERVMSKCPKSEVSSFNTTQIEKPQETWPLSSRKTYQIIEDP